MPRLDRSSMKKNAYLARLIEQEELAHASRDNLRAPTEAIQEVDRDLALHWLAVFPYARQRPIKDVHLKELINEMRLGRFRHKTQISFCEMGGEYCLVNGQHTLSAIVLAPAKILLSVTVTPVSSEEEMADEFARHDTHLTRSVADALYAHRIDEELEVSASDLRRITSAAITFAFSIGELNGNQTTQMSHDTRVAIVRRHGPTVRDALWAIGWPLNRKNAAWMIRKSLLATIAFTYLHQPDISKEFWLGIAADDGLSANDPRKLLLKKYERSSMHTGAVGRGGSSEIIAESHIAKYAATAWNAFVARRSLNWLRIDPASRSATFAGCGEVAV